MNILRVLSLPLAVSALIGLIGCRSPGPEAPPQDDATSPRGAIVIVLDTARADRLSTSGYARPTTPSLGVLAERGVVFEQAVSHSPWTLPSMVALLSGQASERVYRDQRLTASLVTTLRDAGLETAAFTEGGWVSKRFGFDLGFDRWVEQEGAVRLVTGDGSERAATNGGIEATFASARAWIEQLGDRRFFLLIHTYEPHTPYTRRTFVEGLDQGRVGPTFGIERLAELRAGRWVPDAAELEYLGALYDGGIHEADRHIGDLISFLDARGLGARTLVVVTSDHGEELGEHHPSRVADHGHALYDEQLLVPLLLYDPLASPAVSRVRTQVRTLDVMPTVLGRLGLDPGRVDGRTLEPLMRGEETDDRIAWGGHCDAGPRRWFVRHRGLKLVEVAGPDRGNPPLTPAPPPRELYDLVRDPAERQNLADELPRVVQTYRRWLADLRAGEDDAAAFALPDDLDDELLERLRSLGYAE